MQIKPVDREVLAKETAKETPVLTNVIRYTREGSWPLKSQTDHTITHGYSVEDFRKISTSLSSVHGVLLKGTRLVVPGSLQPQVLQLLHAGHFGMQLMKQSARTAGYWLRIDVDIMEQSMTCGTCAEHQNSPPKYGNHLWMLPEKLWSRVHIDHAINFLGSNWLVMVDAPRQSAPLSMIQCKVAPRHEELENWCPNRTNA